MSIRKEHFRIYIETFLNYFLGLTRMIDSEIREKTFPDFLLFPYKVNCIISNTHGLSIEFLERSIQYDLLISKVNAPIEEAVLPQRNSKRPGIEIGNSRFIELINLVMVTQQFREEYVKEMTGGLVCQDPIDGFLHVSVGGDVKIHNSQFGAVIDREPVLTKTGDCLWIFGSNGENDFAIEKAKARALEEFNVYLTSRIHNQFNISTTDERRKTIEIIRNKVKEFKKLINQAGVLEKDLQSYFENIPNFLFFGTRYSKIYPHIILSRENKPDLIPDFLLKRVTDGYWDILDIKLPDKGLIVGPEQRRKYSCDVEIAIAQVNEYREFFDDPRNREKIEKLHRIKIYKPKMLVLIGDSSNIDTEELIRIRDRRTDGEVITYTDLIKHMEALLDLIKT